MLMLFIDGYKIRDAPPHACQRRHAAATRCYGKMMLMIILPPLRYATRKMPPPRFAPMRYADVYHVRRYFRRLDDVCAPLCR